jgi:hypothetical protein
MTKINQGKEDKPVERTRTARVDWEAVERDYRLSRFTQREVCARHGINEASLSRRIKRDREADATRWTRDLSSQVKAAAQALIVAEKVKEQVKSGKDASAVLAAASSVKDVLVGHQRDVVAVRQLSARLLTELGQVTADEADPATVHLRVTSVQKLADTLTKLQAAERRAHSIPDEGNVRPPEDDLTDEQIDAQIEAHMRAAERRQ